MFPAQQSAEKALQAFLAFHEQGIPRTHNIEELLRLCRLIAPELSLGADEIAELTPYAVEMRYDLEFWPDRASAARAIELAQRVRSAVGAALPGNALP